MSSDMHTTLCKSTSDWIKMDIQGNILLVLCIRCSPLSCYYVLIMLPGVVSAVFIYLDPSKPIRSSRIRLHHSSLPFLPLFSQGSILVMIIASVSLSPYRNCKTQCCFMVLSLTSFATCVSSP